MKTQHNLINTNFLHNFLNVLMVVIPALEVFDWTPFFDPLTSLKIAGGLGLLKIVINIVRDGMAGLVKQQPPVV